MPILLLLFLLIGGTLAAQHAEPITRIAFGSCSNQEDSVQMWQDVIRQRPDLWIWLGDNIYGDTHDMTLLEAKYDLQKQNIGYQQLLMTCPVIGVWDDHDYGINDGGKYFSRKKESRDLALDFLNIPAQATIRSREGLYQSHEYGSGSEKVKIILLDTRYFRDTLVASTAKEKIYGENPTGDILGEKQWNWLRKEFAESTASIHIIGSSIQFIANEHGYEKWANFPTARQRMLDLLAELKPRNTIFISGDRHIAEISKLKVDGLPYPLYDFTASGLTHTWESAREEANPFRVGQLIIEKNFGLIRINWNANLPLLEFEVRGLNDHLWLSVPVRLQENK